MLIAEEESPWTDWHGKPLTARGLARFLAPHGIRSSTVRLADGSTPKGYKLEAFGDAWKRYTPENLPQSATSATTCMGTGVEAVLETPHEPLCGGYEIGATLHGDCDVADVADRNGGDDERELEWR